MKIKGKQFENNTINQNNFNVDTGSITGNTHVTNKDFTITRINNAMGNIYQSKLNTDMTANNATIGEKATDKQVYEFPISNTMVKVNNIYVNVGETADCYFSPNGTIIREGGAAQKGDYLYWNSNKFDLEDDDEIDFIYLTNYEYYTLSAGTSVELDPTVNNLVVEYTGDDGTTMTVTIDNTDFIVGNSGGSFVWDIGGTNEHVFTSENEFITQTVNSENYTIWFDGFGSLIFSVRKGKEIKNNLTFIDQDYQGNYYNSIWRDENFIYAACGSGGIRNYSVDTSGNLTFIDEDYQGDNYYGVWGDGNFIYAACYGGGIRSCSVDGTGNLTFIDEDDQGSYYQGVWGDGNFIYAACYSDGIRSYSVDGTGNLTFIDQDDQGSYYQGVWGDGNFIYAACANDGIRSYSVDGTGNLTFIDQDAQGNYYRGVWGDGNFIYAVCDVGGIRSYSVDGTGNLTFIDEDDQGDQYYGVWGDGNFIYTACTYGGIRCYSVDELGKLTFIDEDAQGDYYQGVWGDENFIYAACYDGGIRSYKLT